jgi:selenocysteine-specific translation elongation factor
VLKFLNQELISYFRDTVEIPRRVHSSKLDPFWYAADHCFIIKGRGTVVTGTVLSGQVNEVWGLGLSHFTIKNIRSKLGILLRFQFSL